MLQDLSRYNSSIAHLVTISARQDTTVQKIFDNLKSRAIDPEELALLHNIHQTNIPGHLGRGFIILSMFHLNVSHSSAHLGTVIPPNSQRVS